MLRVLRSSSHGCGTPVVRNCSWASWQHTGSATVAAAASAAGWPDPRQSGRCHRRHSSSSSSSGTAAAGVWGTGTKYLQTVDCHAEGEPARVVISGVPPVPGRTMFEKRAHFMAELDGLRKLLLTEPRGYPCQNADVIVPATLPEASYGVLILEQGKIYPLMSVSQSVCGTRAACQHR